jgi:hypothetical protein
MHDTLIRTTVLATLLLYAGAADAYGTLRCKGRIIDVGDLQAEVLALCGEPTKRATSKFPVRAATRSGFTRFIGYSTAEQWTYSRGWGKFPAVLFFDDGRLRRIEYLSERSRGR